MQLPDHLLRTYRRYQQSEEETLSWIHATASQTSNLSSNSKQIAKPIKSKGQARRKGRAKVRNSSENANLDLPLPANTFSSSRPSLFDILPCVRAIADDPEIVAIPTQIVTTLKTVLQLRERCIARFKSNTSQHDNETIEANTNHPYPVTVLQHALRLLTGKIIPDVKADGQSPSKRGICSLM